MTMSTHWIGKSAVVTGAASGIGRALAQALVARGAVVWLTDIDGEAARREADALGPDARALALDVRDAEAVQQALDDVAAQHGRLNFLFNNAGLGVAGEMHELAIAHFDRLIDVNIRGVVHGVMAAYPRMVRQGHGHIVNTASLAGLAPTPLLTPYSMTKHAVVGLTLSLRVEAAPHGVRVSAICPAAVDTPLLDADNPVDLPRVPWRPDVRRYLEQLSGPPCDVDRLAADTLRGVERNQGLIVLPRQARAVAWLYRMLPGLVQRVGGHVLAKELAHRPSADKLS